MMTKVTVYWLIRDYFFVSDFISGCVVHDYLNNIKVIITHPTSTQTRMHSAGTKMVANTPDNFGVAFMGLDVIATGKHCHFHRVTMWR